MMALWKARGRKWAGRGAQVSSLGRKWVEGGASEQGAQVRKFWGRKWVVYRFEAWVCWSKNGPNIWTCFGHANLHRFLIVFFKIIKLKRPALVICPKLFRDDCRNPPFWWHYSTLRPMLGCYNLMAPGSIIKFQGEPKVETMPKSHISWPEMDIQRKHADRHELKQFDRQPASGHLAMSSTLLGSLRYRSKRNIDRMHRDNSTKKHQQITRRQAEATLSHTDAPTNTRSLRENQRLPTPYPHWCMNWFKMSSLFTRLQILNHTPQTCFQQPELRGWTGALRSGQGQSDVSRKNWCLMGIWKWIKFGVPDT